MSLKKFLKKFKRDRRAVVWVWIYIVVAMFVYSIIWFTAGWATMEVVDAMEAQYTFEEPASATVTFIKTIFAYHPVIFFLGLILYGFVASQRRDSRTDYY